MPVEIGLRIVLTVLKAEQQIEPQDRNRVSAEIEEPGNRPGQGRGTPQAGQGQELAHGAPVQGTGGAAHVEDDDLQACHGPDRGRVSKKGSMPSGLR